jgi:hypothetical protein
LQGEGHASRVLWGNALPLMDMRDRRAARPIGRRCKLQKSCPFERGKLSPNSTAARGQDWLGVL